MRAAVLLAGALFLGACGEGGAGAADDLWSYGRLGLAEPMTWDELVREESRLDTAAIQVRHDVFGRMWRTVRLVRPGGERERLDLRPARIGVRLIGTGQVSQFGPLDPLVYFLDHTEEGFHQIWRHVVLPVGSELIVEAQDWDDFQLEAGRLILHEDGIEFVPGQVEMPVGLCDRYAARLMSGVVCGDAAKRPLSEDPQSLERIPLQDRIPGMPGAPRGGG